VSFGAKVVPCLWRNDSSLMNSVTGSGYADPSFMNSVTGSSYVAKCSNILQDTAIKKFNSSGLYKQACVIFWIIFLDIC